jgi:hypothetical protein
MSKDDNIAWKLNEEIVKGYITSLYDGIEGSTENAMAFAEDYEGIEFSTAVGHKISRHGITYAAEHLHYMELLTCNSGDFEKQFHLPAKYAAEFVVKVRSISDHMTDLDGWVFAVSDPFTDGYGVRRKTLSVILPEICAAVSIRMKEESVRNIERQMHRFSGILPIPFVNRATHKDCGIGIIGGIPEPEKIRFLMTSMRDAESLRTTVCLENYCDIQTPQQSKRRGYLGSPVILSGKVIEAAGSFVTIRSHDGIEMRFRPGLPNMKFPIGQYVAALASVWYGQSSPNTPPPENSEVFHLWKITEEDAKKNDIFGSKRIRGGDCTCSTSNTLSDPVQKLFVDYREKILELRSNSNLSETSIIDIYSGILDTKSISDAVLVTFLKKTKGELHRMLIVECAGLSDLKGIIQKDELVDYICDKNPTVDADKIKGKFRFMEDFDLLSTEDGDVIKVTKTGYRVLSILLDMEVAQSVQPNNLGIIDLTADLPCSIPSLLLQKIKEGGRHERVAIDDHMCNAFWIEKGKLVTAPILEMVGQKISHLEDDVVTALGKRAYGYSADTVFIEMECKECNFFSVNHVLKYLADASRIKVGKEGRYRVTDRQKIIAYLNKNKGKFHSIDTIYNNTSIRYDSNTQKQTKQSIDKDAQELAGDGLLHTLEYPHGIKRYAVCGSTCDEAVLKFFRQVCRQVLFREKKFWDKAMAYSRIRSIVRESVKDSALIAENIIEENVKDGYWETAEDDMVIKEVRRTLDVYKK